MRYLFLLALVQIVQDLDKIPGQNLIIFGLSLKQTHQLAKVVLWPIKKSPIHSLAINGQDLRTDVRKLPDPILPVSLFRQDYRVLHQPRQELIVVSLYTGLMHCYYSMSLGLRFLNSVMMF